MSSSSFAGKRYGTKSGRNRSVQDVLSPQSTERYLQHLRRVSHEVRTGGGGGGSPTGLVSGLASGLASSLGNLFGSKAAVPAATVADPHTKAFQEGIAKSEATLPQALAKQEARTNAAAAAAAEAVWKDARAHTPREKAWYERAYRLMSRQAEHTPETTQSIVTLLKETAKINKHEGDSNLLDWASSQWENFDSYWRRTKFTPAVEKQVLDHLKSIRLINATPSVKELEFIRAIITVQKMMSGTERHVQLNAEQLIRLQEDFASGTDKTKERSEAKAVAEALESERAKTAADIDAARGTIVMRYFYPSYYDNKAMLAMVKKLGTKSEIEHAESVIQVVEFTESYFNKFLQIMRMHDLSVEELFAGISGNMTAFGIYNPNLTVAFGIGAVLFFARVFKKVETFLSLKQGKHSINRSELEKLIRKVLKTAEGSNLAEFEKNDGARITTNFAMAALNHVKQKTEAFASLYQKAKSVAVAADQEEKRAREHAAFTASGIGSSYDGSFVPSASFRPAPSPTTTSLYETPPKRFSPRPPAGRPPAGR